MPDSNSRTAPTPPPAHGLLDGKTVLVTAAAVLEPVAARLAHALAAGPVPVLVPGHFAQLVQGPVPDRGDQAPGMDAEKLDGVADAQFGQVLAENLRLAHAGGRQHIVIVGTKGGLAMSNQVDTAHVRVVPVR